jgi:hypothetical protein
MSANIWEKLELHKALVTFVFVAVLGGAVALYYGNVQSDRARVPELQASVMREFLPLVDSVAYAAVDLDTALARNDDALIGPSGKHLLETSIALGRALEVSSGRVSRAFDRSMLDSLKALSSSAAVDYIGGVGYSSRRTLNLRTYIRTHMGEMSR